MSILKNETKLLGQWLFENGSMQKDATTIRIESLLENYLKLVARNSSGWDALFSDPNDGRFWELTFPFSEMQGGGPPCLTAISLEEARGRYSF
jgi:hypothetical protein